MACATSAMDATFEFKAMRPSQTQVAHQGLLLTAVAVDLHLPPPNTTS